MSLISDPEYLIHNLRLTYLRHSDDPYGPRIITVNPNYASNAYIVAAGLADTEKWPELNAARGLLDYDDDATDPPDGTAPSPSGFGGATGLKYTQTIMANRSGALGMRVNGVRARRSSSSKDEPPPSSVSSDAQSRRLRSDSAPNPVVNGSENSSAPDTTEKRRSISAIASTVDSVDTAGISDNSLNGEDITTPVVQMAPFRPPFARAAEMESRRRARMRRRARLMNQTSDAETESSTDNDLEADSDFGEPAEDEEDDVDLGPPAGASSAEDNLSALSGSVSTAPDGGSVGGPGTSVQNRKQPRLSPINESRPPNKINKAGQPTDTPEPDPFSRQFSKTGGRPNGTPTASPMKHKAGKLPLEELTFDREAPPPPPEKSLLSSMLASQTTQQDNPFAELYASVATRQEGATVIIFFPHSKTPVTAMELTVQRDATVEEVIGFALWSFWEEKWSPRLDDDVGDDEEKAKIKLSAIGWSMRVAEDDGEVDEDFPSLERGKKISSFNMDAYAVVIEKSATQIVKNTEYDAKLLRRPSRIRGQRQNTVATIAASASLATTAVDASLSSASAELSLGQSYSLGPSPHQGGPITFLRVRIADQPNVVHVSTTISVSSGTYMAEALELVCRKRKFDPKEWALMLKDPRIMVPLDRTVASLQGNNELLLIKKSDHPTITTQRTGRTTDPNAPIIQRLSVLPEDQLPDDYTAAYKKYNVVRKLPVLGHNDRALAIDGDYIHIMPAGTKGGLLDSTKTASYHVKGVIQCSQSKESSASFKLVVRREGARKRYDFEAENSKQAEEIVHTIRSLQKLYKGERGGTIKARRSRTAS